MPGAGLGNYDPTICIERGMGSRVWDADGCEYVDYLIGSGPMVLGHSNSEVLEAVQQQIPRGTTFFTNNPHCVELAEEICRAVECAEQVRFFASGTEADMYAVRLARAATGKDKIVKFEGGFHGMFPEAHISLAPSKRVNFPRGVPDSAGLTEAVQNNVLVAPFNDLEFARSLLDEFGTEIAAIIVEPFQRLLSPIPGFLEGLRKECTKRGIVLIFDEVVTGFRFAYGGAQECYGVVPDICTLGKIVGGGFPLAVVAGRQDFMCHFDKAAAPADGFLLHYGTLSGNPVAAVAGLKTLEILRRPGAYDGFYTTGRKIIKGLQAGLKDTDRAWQIVGVPVLFDVVFSDGPMRNYRDCQRGDFNLYDIFSDAFRKNGILKPVGKFYPSLAITDEDIEATREAAEAAAKTLNESSLAFA